MNYTIITENDESKWDDITGIKYHFPKRYLSILLPGTKIIYYKGGINKKVFNSKRLSSQPHYFGIATINKIEDDGAKNHYAFLRDYREFPHAVPFKNNGDYLEKIPDNLKKNYWRIGVRGIDQALYEKIFNLAFSSLVK